MADYEDLPEASTQALLSTEKQRGEIIEEQRALERGQPFVVYDQAVGEGSEIPARVFGVLDDQVVNEGNINESRRKTKIVLDLDDDGNPDFREIVTKEATPQEFTCDAVITESTVDITSGIPAPTKGLLIVSDKIEDIDGVHGKRTLVTVPSWPTLTEKLYEPESDLPITITREIVAAGTALPAIVAGVEVTIKDIDCSRALKTTRAIDSSIYGPSFVVETYRNLTFAYPTVLKLSGAPVAEFAHADGHFTKNDWFLNAQKRSVFRAHANRREGFRSEENARVEIRWSTTKPTPDTTVWNPRMSNLHFNGELFQVNENQVLNDAFTLVASTHSQDAYYGSAGESAGFLASSPTASAYITLVDNEDELLIAHVIEEWGFNLWRHSKVYVTAK